MGARTPEENNNNNNNSNSKSNNKKKKKKQNNNSNKSNANNNNDNNSNTDNSNNKKNNDSSNSILLELKQEGNNWFAKKEFLKAANAYQAGLDHCMNENNNNSNNKNSNDDDNGVNKEIKIALRSNLAMALLKLKRYEQADKECTIVVQQDPTNTKALYRRALAKEGMLVVANENDLSIEQKQEMVTSAIADLDLCLQTTTEKGMVQQARHAKIQLQQLQLNLTPTATTSTNDSSTIASKTQQRQDVMRLLMSRQMANPTPAGEACFLVDWKWWCRWCQHVDFFYLQTNDNDEKQKNSNNNEKQQETISYERAMKVLKFLPPGAVIPTDYDDDDDGDDESSNGMDNNANDNDNDNSEELDPKYPGPIDNSQLLWSTAAKEDAFLRQWYDVSPPLSSSLGSSSSLTSAYTLTNSPRPRPNLVRGYHYEVLPREVYSALRSWYGEVTQSICRRTNANGMIVLYEQQQDAAKSATTTPSLASLVTKCSACRTPHAHARCTRCLSVQYCDRACQESHWPYHKPQCKPVKNSEKDKHKNEANKAANIKQQQQYDLLLGRVGLNNLGNTCFMNSSLQCLSHATPLTRHFLSNKYKADVNTVNPLGTGGKLAFAYDVTMKDLWMKRTDLNTGGGGGITAVTTSSSGSNPASSPTALKRAIALFAPRFAGCLQHDAQEFLAYLLDGLHEDLNRIRKPPYVEMPEVTDGQNMAIAGAEAWDAHLRRNDSLIMDTFYGQFKSTCVCPKCNKVSVSFDAYNHVSLEIPQLHNMTITIPVLLFRAPQKQKVLQQEQAPGPNNNNDNNNLSHLIPQRYGITVRRGSIVADLIAGLSQLTNIPTNRLLLSDVYDHSIYELIQEKRPLSSIRGTDVLAAYEVDPYTNASIHVVASHTYWKSEKEEEQQEQQQAASNKKNRDANKQQQGDDADDNEALQPLFGFPFMTSFTVESTCQQVWDHIWSIVNYLVTDLAAKPGFVDKAGNYQPHDVLRLRIVDNQGKPMDVFPVDTHKDQEQQVNDNERDGNNQNENTTEETTEKTTTCAVTKTSVLPITCTEKVRKFLGKECIENFLFLSLEWRDPSLIDTIPVADIVKNPKSIIQPNKFMTYVDHESLIEAVKKQKSRNGTKGGVSLDQCFETFTKPERLDEHNMWYCSNCKEHVRALKTMELWRLPNVLVVHLKRFEFRHAFRRDKLDTFVNFPLDGLDMSVHCSTARSTATTRNNNIDNGSSSGNDPFVDASVPAIYDLFAVTNHYGRMGFGHYTAFARKWDENCMSSDWALFDDSSVRSVGDGTGPKGVVTPAAYVLFYRRRIFN